MASKLIFLYSVKSKVTSGLQGFFFPLIAVHPHNYSSISFLYFYKSQFLLRHTQVCIARTEDTLCCHVLMNPLFCVLPSPTGRSVCTVSVCVKSMRCAPCPGSWRKWWRSWRPTSRGTPSRTTIRDAPRRSTPGCRLGSSPNRSADVKIFPNVPMYQKRHGCFSYNQIE